jgi:hypothetical protein
MAHILARWLIFAQEGREATFPVAHNRAIAHKKLYRVNR